MSRFCLLLRTFAFVRDTMIPILHSAFSASHFKLFYQHHERQVASESGSATLVGRERAEFASDDDITLQQRNTPCGHTSCLRTDYTFLETKNDIYTLHLTASSSIP